MSFITLLESLQAEEYVRLPKETNWFTAVQFEGNVCTLQCFQNVSGKLKIYDDFIQNINRKGVTSFLNRKRCVTTTEAADVVAAVTARSKQKKTSSSSLERGKPLPPSFAKARPLSLPFLTSTAASTSFSSSSFTTTSTTAILWTWENESATPRTPIFCQTIWPSSLPWTARESETEREEVRVGGGEGGEERRSGREKGS